MKLVRTYEPKQQFGCNDGGVEWLFFCDVTAHMNPTDYLTVRFVAPAQCFPRLRVLTPSHPARR